MSQLALLTDDAFAAGIARLRARLAEAEAHGKEFVLDNDVQFYATTAWAGR